MPLPKNGMQWAPPSVTRDELERWADLYAGRSIGKKDIITPDPDLANANSEADKERRRVRAGLAADIANTSASLVMKGLSLRITEEPLSPDEAAQADDRLAEIIESSKLDLRLLEGAEISAALGGVYLRAVADPSLTSEPYITVIDPTRVEPVFVDGHLVAATFWTEIRIDGTTIYRWVEYRDNRTRTIETGLYRGTTFNIGTRVPLDSIPETTGLPDQSTYPQGVERMVWYVPNAFPNRRHIASPQGRSDIQGAESLCAAVDVVLTSLVRDIRLGRARIIVPTSALTPGAAAGNGSTWNAEKEVFTQLDVDPQEQKIEMLQGEIRTTEHLEAAIAMVERAVTIAGYSPQTFGLNISGSAESGTALKVREARTIATTEAKRKYWTPVIADIAYHLLVLDSVVFGNSVVPGKPRVEWAPVRDDDPLEHAQTIDTLMRAKAISVETAVRRANPELPEVEVESETARILQEAGLSLNAIDLPGEELFQG